MFPETMHPGSGAMNKNIGAKHAAEQERRVQFNTNKLEAVLCILLSAAISLGTIGWLFF